METQRKLSKAMWAKNGKGMRATISFDKDWCRIMGVTPEDPRIIKEFDGTTLTIRRPKEDGST